MADDEMRTRTYEAEWVLSLPHMDVLGLVELWFELRHDLFENTDLDAKTWMIYHHRSEVVLAVGRLLYGAPFLEAVLQMFHDRSTTETEI